MKSTLFLFVMLLIGVPALHAGDDIRTLPATIYSQMQSGKKLDRCWIGPAYDKAKGFKLGSVAYRAENRNGTIIEYLPVSLKTVATAGSPYTLNVTVVEVTTKTFTGFGYIKGKITVEGQILAKDGTLVAAFRTRGAMPESLGGTDAKGGVDEIVSAIVKDLL